MSKHKSVDKMSAPEFESWIVQMRKNGRDINDIVNTATANLNSETEKIAIAARIKDVATSMKTYHMTERIIQNDLCKTTDSRDYYLINKQTKELQPLDQSLLAVMLTPEYLFRKATPVVSTYYPQVKEVFIQKGDVTYLNRYIPAPWSFGNFFRNEPYEPCDLPQIYHDFFVHLTDGDMDSYNYMLKWIAGSLRGRNFSYLVTVGAQGIGKGMLYEICKKLHGEDNAVMMLGKTFTTSSFNGELENRTLFYLDEIDKLKETDTNKVKNLLSGKNRIEAKGKNARFVDNHLNVMISSNNINSLSDPEEERRYSIITTTDVKTIDRWPGQSKAVMAALLEDENIAKLGRFLMTKLQYTEEEMMTAFKSSRQITAIKARDLLDWQDYFLFNYCREKSGQHISFRQVKTDILKALDYSKINITIQTMKDLRKRFKGFFTVKELTTTDGKGEYGLLFYDKKDHPTREQCNIKVIETEE